MTADECAPGGGRRITPLHLRLWPSEAEGFTSQNDEILGIIDLISGAAKKRGVYVIDRGGDGDWLFAMPVRSSRKPAVRWRCAVVASLLVVAGAAPGAPSFHGDQNLPSLGLRLRPLAGAAAEPLPQVKTCTYTFTLARG